MDEDDDNEDDEEDPQPKIMKRGKRNHLISSPL